MFCELCPVNKYGNKKAVRNGITFDSQKGGDSLAGGVGHGVDREIPPRQVGGQVVHKLYVIGVAVVAVAA